MIDGAVATARAKGEKEIVPGKTMGKFTKVGQVAS